MERMLCPRSTAHTGLQVQQLRCSCPHTALKQRRHRFTVFASQPSRDRKGFGKEPPPPEPPGTPAAQQQDSPRLQTIRQQRNENIQEVPEIVNQRMLGRIILCAGVPTFTGVLLFPFFYWLKITQGIKVPMPLVYFVQSLTFGGGLLGITYGILSASWDPKKDGSWLGLDEFKENVPNMLASIKNKNR